MTAFDVTLVGFFLLILNGLSKRLPFTVSIAVFFGMVWGSFGGKMSIFSMELIAKTVLIFFLFFDGARLHLPKAFHYHSKRLPLIGFTLTLIFDNIFSKILFFQFKAHF